MKLKPGFITRKVAGREVAVSSDASQCDRFITLNDTAAFLWHLLESQDLEESQLVARLLEEYDVDEQTAKEHIAQFVAELRQQDFLA